MNSDERYKFIKIPNKEMVLFMNNADDQICYEDEDWIPEQAILRQEVSAVVKNIAHPEFSQLIAPLALLARFISGCDGGKLKLRMRQKKLEFRNCKT
jgi:hypothetical protein